VERKEVRRVRPLLSELQVPPEWQELAKDRPKSERSGEICRRASGHGDILCCRYKELGRLRKDTTLTNRVITEDPDKAKGELG
jgi:hypothetical protein